MTYSFDDCALEGVVLTRGLGGLAGVGGHDELGLSLESKVGTREEGGSLIGLEQRAQRELIYRADDA